MSKVRRKDVPPALLAHLLDRIEQRGIDAQSGLARLNLVLGVDRDCDLATGDPDGVDGATTIPVEIWVSTDSHAD